MKRPGPVGVTIVLAFVVVAAIEFRTLLGMFGLDVATQTYYGIASALVALAVLALFALPKKESAGTNRA
jgi:type IV secretory pathway VirB2 component (pilin)